MSRKGLIRRQWQPTISMRVLHINAGNLYGGVETLLVTLARCRNLCPEMEPSFALCFDGRLSRELTEAGVPVHRLGEVRTSRFWTVLHARRALRRLLSEHAFDVVVTHMSWSHALFGPEVRNARVALVNWVHGLPTGGSWLERWAGLTPPSLAICNSKFTASGVHRLFPGAPSEVVYCPVEASSVGIRERSVVRQELGVAEDAVVILQVSRMEAWKGHRLHIEALAKLKDLSDWTCWLAGGVQCPKEREYLSALQGLARELGLSDRIRFLGQRSDVLSLMAAADIFCQPNLEPEPFGIVFIEALLAGLPVVSTRMGGAVEIVDESCGFLVLPDDSSALADCLRTLIESPKQRRELDRTSRQRAIALCDPLLQVRKVHQTLARALFVNVHQVLETANL